MKTEFLAGLGLDKAVIDQIMAENGRDIESIKGENTSLKQQLSTAKAQIKEANAKIEAFANLDVDAIKAEAADWKTKAEQVEQAAREQIEAIRYDQAAEAYANTHRFTSDLARRAFVAELKAQKLPVKDGVLLGADDFAKQIKESNPTAFEKAPSGGVSLSNTAPPDASKNTNEYMNSLIRGAIGVKV